ncbi:aflatoxin biosynthesis ketoreductase nor-1 [Penicillium brasilianum]|uniref:Aflatoxin biosynthesis ketoreductase nor-1 n=1 Tax=Penicillium brasilianum TaxID=104259 RepID=A0A1S9RNA5_PENBI|nr:aflatoxin biosynthesis ketoreductase nor-1 [Penicillium brasilianum]
MAHHRTTLVTGASRGIGQGIVRALLQEPSTTVIAAVRDLSPEACSSLRALPKCTGAQLIIIKIDAAISSDAAEAIVILKRDYAINSLDIVIANAGIAHSGTTVLKSSMESINNHFLVNTLGPVSLLQATAPLLKASKCDSPRFVVISSLVGSISGIDMLQHLPPIVSPYGASKAALNWFLRRVHFEERWLITLAIHPGVVATDFLSQEVSIPNSPNDSSLALPISVEESVRGVLERINSVTKENGSGTFQSYDDKLLPW